jgi:hypothetical protein
MQLENNYMTRDKGANAMNMQQGSQRQPTYHQQVTNYYLSYASTYPFGSTPPPMVFSPVMLFSLPDPRISSGHLLFSLPLPLFSFVLAPIWSTHEGCIHNNMSQPHRN